MRSLWPLTRLAWSFFWRLQIRLVWLLPLVVLIGAVVTNLLPPTQRREYAVVAAAVAPAIGGAANSPLAGGAASLRDGRGRDRLP